MKKIIAILLISAMSCSQLLAQEVQEPLLELPGFTSNKQNSQGSDEGLKLLTPHELRGLYEETEEEGEEPLPTALPVPTVDKIETPPLVKQPEQTAQENIEIEAPDESYAELVESLENESQHGDAGQYDINKLWSHGSLMLLPKETDIFNTAISRHIKSQSEEDLVEEEPLEQEIVSEPEKIQNQERSVTEGYPFIMVNSIMYRSPQNWAVWINGVKYSPYEKEKLPGLLLTRVTKHKVNIQWENIVKEPLEEEMVMNEADDNTNPILPDTQLPIDENYMAGATMADMEYNENELLAAEDELLAVNLEESSLESNAVSKVEEKVVLPKNVVHIGGDRYVVELASNQMLITQNFKMHEGRALTQEIHKIQQQRLAHIRKEAADAKLLESAAAADNGAVDNLEGEAVEMDPNAKREEENLAKLLQLYKESGLADSALNP